MLREGWTHLDVLSQDSTVQPIYCNTCRQGRPGIINFLFVFSPSLSEHVIPSPNLFNQTAQGVR